MSLQAVDLPSDDEILRMTTEIVSAYVARNQIATEGVPNLISSVYRALNSLQPASGSTEETVQKPAVPIRRSITPDYVICLEDGKKLKMLKRYLRTNYNMTPEEYRAKWGLKPDYPMVAPSYAKQRSKFAKQIGLGHKGRTGRKGQKST